MSRTRIFWIILGIVVLGVFLRSYHITDRSLWFDEAFSWRLIQFPFSEMIARDSTDVHPPLYYILLQGWGYVFGSSLLALRSFSVACAGVASICSYVFAAYAFRSKRAGVYAATFFTLSPWAISYAWEARMYSLGMIFALLSSTALLHAVRKKSLPWFGVYGILAAAFIYTHYYGLFTVAAHVLFVLTAVITSTRWRIGEMVHARIFWGGVLSLCIALALFAPWFPVFLKQTTQVQESYWVPPVSALAVTHTFYQLFIPTKFLNYSGVSWFLITVIPTVGTIILWVYALVRYRKQDGVYLTVLLGSIPILASILVSLGGRSLYNDRFFAFAGIFIFTLIAFVVSSLKKPLLRRFLFMCVVAGLVFTFAGYWNELDIANKKGSHAATQYLFTHRTNGEQVLVSSPFVYFAILHYATEEFDAPEVPHLYSSTGELSHFSGGPILTQQDIIGPKDIEQFTHVVWVVDTTGFYQELFQAPSNWKEESRETFPEVFSYQGDIIVRKFTVR